MSGSVDIQVLIDLIGAIRQFGERLVVQRQLAAIVILVLCSWLAAQCSWYLVGRHIERWVNNWRSSQFKRHLRYEVMMIKHAKFPMFAIFGLDIVYHFFLMRGWHAGLLAKFAILFWAILVYRLFIGVLYARLGRTVMQRYHYRFIAPLFTLILIVWFLDNLVPINHLADIKIWDGFTDPITLGSLLIATVGFYFWYDGSGVVRDVLHSLIAPHSAADPGTVEVSLKIGRYIFISIGILIVLTVLGFDSTMLAFATGGLSVGIGFGSKEIIGNMISGILLLFDQSLRPGDIVSVEGQMGVVKNIGIRATNVNTLNNVEVLIPNQTFLTSSVTTYTKSDRVVRILVAIETANRHSPFEVREALLAAANRHSHVAETPRPAVFFTGHGDTSHRFELAVWFDDPTRTKVLTSDLYFMIHEEFDARDLEPSTPQRDIQFLNSAFMPQENHMLQFGIGD
ncbi:mechanosensitive ion channel [Chloroflexi bacterium TSY]|nr:mechanosensitive ion channel [Chloroflexi bacterium TSY]